MGRGMLAVLDPSAPATELPLDVAFPVLHGPGGEDGTIQGLLELAGIPYVGAGVPASSVGMDKALMKALFAHAGIPVCAYCVIPHRRWRVDPERIQGETLEALGLPCFVKPANLGSSVGISRVTDTGAFPDAMELAFEHDRKVVVEEAVSGREVECSVLGNDDPAASVPGEIIPCEEFYSYSAKYLKPSDLRIPAPLEAATVDRVRDLAIRSFQAIDCRGMARVDFFVRADGTVLVNEINTIPGFTAISMYSKLWEASGIPYPQLLDRLIELALEAAAEGRSGAGVQGGRGEASASNAEHRTPNAEVNGSGA
jgi:D-alanine-D-alanine ligase